MRRPTLLVAALLLVAAAACGDDDGGGADRPLLLGGELSIAAALAELPVPDGDELTILVADLDAAAEANGAGPRPEDPDEVAAWLGRAGGHLGGDDDSPPPVHVPAVEVAGVRAGTPAAEVEEELGWSLADVTRVAEVRAPPFRFTVVTGDVDEEALEGADLEDLGDGVWSAGTGDDGEVDADATSAARPLGTPLRMAAADGRLAASSSTEATRAWLEGGAETLAEDAGLGAIAAALDDGGAVAAMLAVTDFAPPPTPGPGGDPDARPITTPFDAVGIGWGVSGGEAAVTVAYAFADEGAAEGAVDQVSSAWTEGDSLRTAQPLGELAAVEDVQADGALVVVRLTIPDGSRPQVVADMAFGRDLPFVHR